MNVRKVATSFLSIVVVGVALTGATYALFSDTATSTGNTFSTGSADLLISADALVPDGPDGYGPSIAGASFGNIFPGFTGDKVFWLKNDSNADVALVTTAALLNLGGSNIASLPDNLLIMFTCDTDANGLATGNTSTTEKSVTAWIAGPAESLGTIGLNTSAANATTQSDQDELLCKMTARLPSSADNTLAGTDLTFDASFVGTQAP
jgi:predicted ribosomally synthesized peptide with SipW-like signal peptide